jgi:hypothetical protein
MANSPLRAGSKGETEREAGEDDAQDHERILAPFGIQVIDGVLRRSS